MGMSSLSIPDKRMNLRLLRWLILVITLGALVGAPAHAAASVRSDPPVYRLVELGYGDRTAQTMYGTLDYFFPVPAGEMPTDAARLELLYSHSPLLEPERSTMTVLVNGVAVQSVRLTPDTQSRASLTVPLPASLFGGEGFFVQVRFYMRLTRDVCEETRNPALWATIHGDSRLFLPTRPVQEYYLEQVDRLFAPPPLERPPLVLAVPTELTPEELEAAGLVAFQLGRWAAARQTDPRLAVRTIDGAGSSSGRADGDTDRSARSPQAEGAEIWVGSAPKLASALPWGAVGWNGASVTLRDRGIPAEHGVLAFANSPLPRLLISGATPAAVRVAAQTLAAPERRALLNGAYAAVADAPTPAKPTAPWTGGAASFAQLGVSTRIVSGPGEHQIDLAMSRPAGWRLHDGSTLTLDVEVSPAVHAATSWIAARVNGIDLGMQPLQFDPSRPRRYTFALPADQLTTTLDGKSVRELNLTVRLFLDLPEEQCISFDGDSISATLLPSSAWRLPHDVDSALDLGRFPAPLLSVDSPLPLAVVLPPQPVAEERAAALRLLAALGRWADVDGLPPPRLITADRLDDPGGRHLILIGGAERHPLSAEVASRRPEYFADAPPAVYRPDAAEQSRLILAPAPWRGGGAVLVIEGATPDDLMLGVAALEQRDTLVSLSGPVAVIRPGLPPQPGADPPETVSGPASLMPQVETPLLERLPGWQIAGAVLLGAFISALIILLTIQIRARMRRRAS